ncbi:MAG: hypothetical protein QOG35_2236 [Solirubrobacteraceae bacterium]|nr:hypothetical protein [Solirubrobacteraceae bacterium]
MTTASAELEWELEQELEGEYEGEEFLGTLARGAASLLGGALGEEEYEWEAAGSRSGRCPHCARVYQRLATQGRPARSVPPSRVAAVAARAALRGVRDPYLPCRRPRAGAREYELNPVDRVYPARLMEHMGHAATEAESEAEAEAFIGALIPLAARLAPVAGRAIMRSAPQLIRGVSSVARTHRANPATRPLVRALPTVVRRTTADIARRVSRGQPVTPQWAVRDLARRTAQVLGNPRETVRVVQRAQVADRRHHHDVCRPPMRQLVR